VRFVRDTVRVTDRVLEILGVFVLVFGADVGMPDRDTVIDSVLDTVTEVDVVGVAGNVVGILERVIDRVGVLVLGGDVGMPDRDAVTDGVFVLGADVGMPERDTVIDSVLETVTEVEVVGVAGNVVGMLERVIVFVTDHVASKEGFTVTAGDGVSVTDLVLDTVTVLEVVGVAGNVVGMLERVIVLVGVLVLGADVGMPDGETVTDRVLDTVTVFEVDLDPGNVVGILERVIVLVGDHVAGKEGITVTAGDGVSVTDRVLDTVTVFVVDLDPGNVVGILERVIVLVGDHVAGKEGITVTAGDGVSVTDRVLDTVTVFEVDIDPGNVVGILERVIVLVGDHVAGKEGITVTAGDGVSVTDRVLDTVIVIVVVGVAGNVVGILERVGVSVFVFGADVGMPDGETVTDRVLDTVIVVVVVGIAERVGVSVMVLGAEVGILEGDTVTDRVLDTVTVFEVVGVTVMVVIPEIVCVMVLGADVGMPDGETENVLDTVTEVVRVTVMVLGGEVGILDADSVPTMPEAETVSDGLATV